MKTFSKLLIKECGVEPQNLDNGVMNHYIPIENIVINVRNLFAQYWGLVVEPGEDNQTLKIYNSQFTSEDTIFRILNFKPDGRTSLLSYVTMQGLPKVKLVNLGSVYVVYFYATDIAGQEDPESLATNSLPANQDCANPDNCICDKTCTDDMCSAGYTECEISDLSKYIIESDEQTPLFYSGEIDLEDPTLRAIREITGESDKVKACGDFEKAIENNIQLPDGYYWKGVKDKDGLESIALRKKFMKRRPFGKEQECVKSLMNIYNNEEGGIWVEPFDHKDRLDREESQLLDSILAFIQAVPSDDPCVWSVKPDLGDDMNESALVLDGYQYLITDEFGQDIISVNTEEDAKKVKDYWEKTNKVKCTITKINNGIDFSKLSESLISKTELNMILNESKTQESKNLVSGYTLLSLLNALPIKYLTKVYDAYYNMSGSKIADTISNILYEAITEDGKEIKKLALKYKFNKVTESDINNAVNIFSESSESGVSAVSSNIKFFENSKYIYETPTRGKCRHNVTLNLEYITPSIAKKWKYNDFEMVIILTLYCGRPFDLNNFNLYKKAFCGDAGKGWEGHIHIDSIEFVNKRVMQAIKDGKLKQMPTSGGANEDPNNLECKKLRVLLIDGLSAYKNFKTAGEEADEEWQHYKNAKSPIDGSKFDSLSDYLDWKSGKRNKTF